MYEYTPGLFRLHTYLQSKPCLAVPLVTFTVPCNSREVMMMSHKTEVPVM